MRAPALVATSLAVACSGPTHYYRLDYEVHRRATSGDDISFPAEAARKQLGRARVVAFSKPDECVEPGGAKLMGQDCGVLMSALEAAASDAGFEVVSWQALHGTEPSITYAARHKVDFLFEVTRFAIEDTERQVYTAGDLHFYRHATSADQTPVSVSPTTRLRCESVAAAGLDGDASRFTTSLELKVVSVQSGRSVWQYHQVIGTLDLQDAAQQVVYPARSELTGGRKAMLVVGGVLFAGGLSIATSDKDGVGVGLFGMGAGGVLMYLGGKRSEPTPDDVICKARSVPDPFAPAPAETAPVEAGAYAESSRFSGVSTQGSGGADERAYRMVTKGAAQVFFTTLAFARRDPPPRAFRRKREPDPSSPTPSSERLVMNPLAAACNGPLADVRADPEFGVSQGDYDRFCKDVARPTER